MPFILLDFCDSKFKFLQAIQYPSCSLGGYSSTYWNIKEIFFFQICCVDFPLLSIIQWYWIIFPFTVLNNLFDPCYLYSLPYMTSFYPNYSVLLCVYVCIYLFIYQESVHLSLNHLLLHFPEFFSIYPFLSGTNMPVSLCS